MIIMVINGNSWILDILEKKQRKEKLDTLNLVSCRSPTPRSSPIPSPVLRNPNKSNIFNAFSTTPKSIYVNPSPIRYARTDFGADNSTHLPPSFFSKNKKQQTQAAESLNDGNFNTKLTKKNMKYNTSRDENVSQNKGELPMFRPSKKYMNSNQNKKSINLKHTDFKKYLTNFELNSEADDYF